MQFSARILGAALGVVLAAGTATAEEDKAIQAAIKARQSLMQLYAYNLGVLGAMAKGEIDYNATGAQAAADNLVAVNGLKMGAVWLPESDNFSAKNTRALPELWENGPDVAAKAKDLRESLVAMQAAAGTGADPMKAALGDVGKSCGACHKAYRQP